jgi:tetratricopeptide (TPR) repeat protein
MYELAKLYKDNGVKMFKEYPLFAHNYFNLAAKCLLSFNSYDDNDDFLKNSTIKKQDYRELLQNVYTNIAACLIKQNRYDEIPSILEFSCKEENPSDKVIFRLATAYYQIHEYEKAKVTIEKIDFKKNKELVQLMTKIQDKRKVDNNNEADMAKRMLFG